MFKIFSIITLSVLLGTFSGGKPLHAMEIPHFYQAAENESEETDSNSREEIIINELETGMNTPAKVATLLGSLLLTIYILDMLEIAHMPMNTLVTIKELMLTKLKALFGPKPRTRSRDLIRTKFQNLGLIKSPTPTWQDVVLNKLRELGILSPATAPTWRQIMARATQNHLPRLHERLARIVRLARMISLLSQFSHHI